MNLFSGLLYFREKKLNFNFGKWKTEIEKKEPASNGKHPNILVTRSEGKKGAGGEANLVAFSEFE